MNKKLFIPVLFLFLSILYLLAPLRYSFAHFCTPDQLYTLMIVPGRFILIY